VHIEREVVVQRLGARRLVLTHWSLLRSTLHSSRRDARRQQVLDDPGSYSCENLLERIGPGSFGRASSAGGLDAIAAGMPANMKSGDALIA
jgi:hypothetical protein